MSRTARPHLKKRSDGRYACRYKNKWFMGYTEKECFDQRDEYIRNEKLMVVEDAYITVQKYAAKWVTTYKSHLTTAAYNDIVRNLKKFCDLDNNGRKELKSITPMDIQAYFKLFNGMSRSSIMHANEAIKGLFASAMDDRIIDYDPTKKIEVPKAKSGSHRAITQHERDLIHSVQHPLRPAIMLMLYAGLRRGEALAIDINTDVDFKNKTITVNNAIRFENQSQPSLVDPKTIAGRRTVPLLSVLQDELKNVQGIVAKPSKRKKTGKDDEMYKYMSESSFRSAWASYISALETAENGISKRWYGKTKEQKQLKAENKLPPWKEITIRPHDLRHSYATMIRDAGVDLKLAMLWMGHSDQSMLLKIYDHPDDYRIAEASKNVESMLLSRQNGRQTKINP